MSEYLRCKEENKSNIDNNTSSNRKHLFNCNHFNTFASGNNILKSDLTFNKKNCT